MRLYNKARNDQWEESEIAMSVIARFGTGGGGNTPIVVMDKNENDLSENNRPVDGEQSSGQLYRTGRIQ